MDREDGAFWRFMAKKPRTAFDNPKPTYSVATRDLLETLMKEARLSQLQRKRLLSPSSESTPTARVPVDVKRPAPVKTKQTRKRPLTAIVKSGVLEREQFNPRNATKGRDPGEKERLQDIMAYGRPLKPENSELLGLEMTIRYEKGPDKPRMEEVENEILEREAFLQKMTELGRRKKYESIIQNEISLLQQELSQLRHDT